MCFIAAIFIRKARGRGGRVLGSAQARVGFSWASTEWVQR